MIYSEEDYAGKEVTQHVTYTVEKINGVFYIVDLAVSSSGETL